jgi:DNA-binding transcriptional MerR regulator
MAVRTVAAYQTIDGRCFPDKQQAYREDFQYLAQQMGNIKYKGTSLSQIEKYIDSVNARLAQMKEVCNQIKAEEDASLPQIEKYIDSIDTCLAQMLELRDQIKDEEDAAVAKSFQA